MVSMVLRRASQTVSTLFLLAPPAGLSGELTGQGYMVVVVSSSLEQQQTNADLRVELTEFKTTTCGELWFVKS